MFSSILYTKRNIIPCTCFIPCKRTATTGFKFQRDYARVLSGEEEGVFGWLTVNYLLGTLASPHTLGALDMGGASTQISFIPDQGQSILENIYPLKLPHFMTKNVYTHSFLFYGKDQMLQRVCHQLALAAVEKERGEQKGGQQATPSKLSDSPGTGGANVLSFDNPCLPSGYTTDFVDSFPSAASVSVGTNGAAPHQQRRFLQQGSGDFNACRGLIYPLLYKNTPCMFHPDSRDASPAIRVDDHGMSESRECSIHGEYQPPLPQGDAEHNTTFVAFAGYAYMATFLGLSPHSSLEQITVRRLLCPSSVAGFAAKKEARPSARLSFYWEPHFYTHSVRLRGCGLSFLPSTLVNRHRCFHVSAHAYILTYLFSYTRHTYSRMCMKHPPPSYSVGGPRFLCSFLA